jgi:hypothetical protein
MWMKIAAVAILLAIAGYVVSLFWMPHSIWDVLRHAHHLFLAGKFVLFVGVAMISGGAWLWQKWSQRQTTA